VSGFSADWLTLREPYDLRARNAAVLNSVADAFKGKSKLHIIDFGCGTGSTLRALAPRLNAAQDWRLIDYDRTLLARAVDSAAALNVRGSAITADLDRELETVLQVSADLLTTSALLDLVSDEWLERLANCVSARGIPVYAALSYDGRIEISPAHRADEAIVDAVNQHQRSDKGFGPALGPLAAASAISKFMQRGFSVVQGPADWIASSEDGAFQSAIVQGWGAAAHETGALAHQDIEDWLAFRQEEIAAGHASLRVGHIEFFAVPPSRI
jgi:SAM-dependent methyltransferase